MGVFFLKARTGDSRHLAKKTRMLPFLGEPILLIRNSFILVLSDHFWGVNFDFCANFINQNSFCDIRENTPKSYGMGLSPPPPYGKSPQFFDFFALMASLSRGFPYSKGLTIKLVIRITCTTSRWKSSQSFSVPPSSHSVASHPSSWR